MLKAAFKKLYVLILLLIISFEILPSQPLDYPNIFGEDWNKALIFERENRNWMESLLNKNDIPYALAIAVIFPELVRYSALRDKMEITLLKALYVNLGDEYANFSIGSFQMKPSFASMIREQSLFSPGHRMFFPNDIKNSDIREFRKNIIAELEDPGKQINYLIAFSENL